MAEEAPVHDSVRASCQLVGEADIYTFVGGRTEIAGFVSFARDCLGKSSG